MWANYRALSFRKMIYTNTASVSGNVLGDLTEAMGDSPQITAVLLTCRMQRHVSGSPGGRSARSWTGTLNAAT